MNFLYRIHRTILNYADKVDYPYLVFGIFCVVTYPLYYAFWYFLDPAGYENLALRLIAVIFAIPLIFHKFWLQKLKQFLPIYFYLLILYAFPFLFTFFLLKNNFSLISIFNSLCILVLCILILDLISLSIILLGGIFLGFWLYHLTAGTIILPHNSMVLIIVYLSMLIGGFVFSRSRDYIKLKTKWHGMKTLAATIVHELRTPLRNISLAANNIKEYFPKLIQSHKIAVDNHLNVPKLNPDELSLLLPVFNKIDSEVQSAFTFINMIWANIRGLQKANIPLTQLSMSSCMQNTILRYPFTSSEKKVIHFEKQNDFYFMGDEEAIIHIFFNLFKNALYYIKGRKQPEIRIWFDTRGSKNSVHFRDNGEGISKKALSHIFDQFFSQTLHGMGIGLSFCKSTMKALGGKIICRSKAGEYTEFILSFPKIKE